MTSASGFVRRLAASLVALLLATTGAVLGLVEIGARWLADFQNRVLARYADAHQLPFIDLAAFVPADPDLSRTPSTSTARAFASRHGGC
jgi:hypothetical protein